MGHDVSSEIWQQTLTKGVQQFREKPSILQKFYKGKKVEARYFDPGKGKTETMISRVRLTPYYFVSGGSARLGGILATLCPQDKKKIHGMGDAIMVPCATRNL